MDTTLQDPLVGRVLDGRYRIESRIAAGGMATVYRALDTRLDRVVALKVMHTSLAADASFVERFIREAKSVARLSHPNVVAVYDQGTDGAYVYLAMEYVAGCTLRDVLRERGALQPRAALDILEPALAALGAAHRAGYVHRDMKPENVLIGDDGRVKVADFGLVHTVDTITNTTGTVLGTVAYLAPEQLEGGVADPRADVYACGVLFYEMLTGTKPHTGDTPAQVLHRHMTEDVPPASAEVPGLAAGLDDLIASATSREPDLRPADARDLLAVARQTRSQMSAAELDAVPPAARDNGSGAPRPPAGPEDRTRVIARAPLAAGSEEAMDRTSRLRVPPADRRPAPPGPRGRGGRGFAVPSRRVLLVIAAVLIALGAGTGIWYINSGQFTEVPPLLTKTEQQARERLNDEGLEVGSIRRAYSSTDDRGTVMATDPASGERIRGNGRVALTISLGPKNVTVPRLTGEQLAEARKKLSGAGLEPGMVTRAFDDEVPSGAVISTDPAAGVTRRAGTAVALKVSKGEAVELEDVTGLSPSEARKELESAGLKVRISGSRVNSAFDAGQVADQNPASGAQAAEGDTVTLTLSKGPVMVEVPDVEGMEADAAESALRAKGFEVRVERGLFGIFDDKVDDQSVDPGEKAPKGSEIVLKVE